LDPCYCLNVPSVYTTHVTTPTGYCNCIWLVNLAEPLSLHTWPYDTPQRLSPDFNLMHAMQNWPLEFLQKKKLDTIVINLIPIHTFLPTWLATLHICSFDSELIWHDWMLNTFPYVHPQIIAFLSGWHVAFTAMDSLHKWRASGQAGSAPNLHCPGTPAVTTPCPWRAHDQPAASSAAVREW
jgi:hypothetical protein